MRPASPWATVPPAMLALAAMMVHGSASAQPIIGHGPEGCHSWTGGNIHDRRGGENFIPLDSNAVAAVQRGEARVQTRFRYTIDVPGPPHRNSSCDKRYLFSLSLLAAGSHDQRVPELVNYQVDWAAMPSRGWCTVEERVIEGGIGIGGRVDINDRTADGFRAHMYFRNNHRADARTVASCNIHLIRRQ